MSIIEKAVKKSEGEIELKALKKESQLSKNSQDIKAETATVEFKNESVSEAKHEDGSSVESNNKTLTSKINSIDRDKLSKKGYLCPKNTNSQLFEEYRIIKRPLINNAFKAQKDEINRANLVLITSSQSGEGKTFTAINLALSIANERDKKVLLIDADVAKPSITDELGIKDYRYGLIDYLDNGELDFSMMMIKTDIPGLSIIPAGKKHSYSTELLASKAMTILADELHSRYSDRIVIFDSPPLLATTQAEILAGLVGQSVLVVEAETTPQSMVTESVNKLKVCDVVLGLLNKSMHNYDLNYFGYGQYGTYGQHGR